MKANARMTAHAWPRLRGGAPTAGREGGQALVEFALVLIPFMLVLLAVFDLGRGIYTYNAVSQASHEIARVTAVHPYGACCTLGTSTEATAIKNTQKAQVPGLTDAGISITCVDIRDNPITASACRPGDFVKVAVSTSFSPVTPLLGQIGPVTLSSTGRIEWP
jgi:Flp pilus assembly protein TadG